VPHRTISPFAAVSATAPEIRRWKFSISQESHQQSRRRTLRTSKAVEATRRRKEVSSCFDRGREFSSSDARRQHRSVESFSCDRSEAPPRPSALPQSWRYHPLETYPDPER